MVEARKARAVGFNHVALEVGDIEEALAFYSRLFDFKLRGKATSDTNPSAKALQRPPAARFPSAWGPRHHAHLALRQPSPSRRFNRPYDPLAHSIILYASAEGRP